MRLFSRAYVKEANKSLTEEQYSRLMDIQSGKHYFKLWWWRLAARKMRVKLRKCIRAAGKKNPMSNFLAGFSANIRLIVNVPRNIYQTMRRILGMTYQKNNYLLVIENDHCIKLYTVQGGWKRLSIKESSRETATGFRI